MSPLVASMLLIVALAPLAWLLLAPRRPQAGPRYPRLICNSWIRFGLPSVALLTASGQLSALVAIPDPLAPAQAALGVAGMGVDERAYILGSAAIGVAAGILLGMMLTAWRAWRGRPEGTLFGDAGAVRPEPGELGWASALAVTVGVTEEAYFRLLLPLLAAEATGSAAAGFAGATLLFGAAHRYQGWRGVAATTVAGAAMAAGYLATGSLLAMMAFHAAGDLGHLVLRPAVRGWVERRR